MCQWAQKVKPEIQLGSIWVAVVISTKIVQKWAFTTYPSKFTSLVSETPSVNGFKNGIIVLKCYENYERKVQKRRASLSLRACITDPEDNNFLNFCK